MNAKGREEKLDAELKCLGFDPEQLGRMGWKLAMKCMAEEYENEIRSLKDKNVCICGLCKCVDRIFANGSR